VQTENFSIGQAIIYPSSPTSREKCQGIFSSNVRSEHSSTNRHFGNGSVLNLFGRAVQRLNPTVVTTSATKSFN